MQKKMKSKALAILMSLVMVFTMMPVMGAPAYADDPAPAAPGIALGPDVLSVGSNTADAATVHMAGTKWRVIGYKKDGVASIEDTMTLFAASYLKEYVQFNPESNENNLYKGSYLHNEVMELTHEGKGIFSEGEKSAIVKRDLAGENVTDALLWPLSAEEANAMSSDLRASTNHWWLRSPGKIEGYAACVKMDGTVLSGAGNSVTNYYGLRPAFNYDLGSVILTSAAAGGKSSGDVGAGSLKSVEPNSSNEWKLTLKSGHDNFKVENISTCDGKTVNIKYSGAVAKKGEYISAIITDEKEAVKYYGNLIEFADEDSTSGTAKVTIEDKMESTDKLYIFNEQLNGEKNTDYSSALNRIDVPEPEGHNYLWEYVNDGEHNGVCDKCGGEITEEHTYQEGRCTVCNGACGHSSLNDSYSHDLYIHWKTCNYCKNNIDPEEHKWQDEWTADGTKHWHECEVCQRKKDEAAHSGGTATCTEKAKCEVCNGEYGDLGEHKYSAWKNLDATQHQRVCATDTSHVEKANHSWDEGKVTKAATEKATGVRTFTCTVCKATKTETIPKLKPSAPKVSGTPLAKMTTKKNSITISWNKIQGAAGYDIFFARCNHDNKKIATKNVKTIKGNRTFKWTKSGLKKGTAYKFYVRAYVTKNGKKTYVSKSPMFHAYTANGTKNYTNAKSVKVNRARVTLKKGETFRIKAKVKKVNKKKKLMPKSHAPKLRYMTSDSRIATVSKSGRITAKGSGTCTIVAFAHNGVSKSIKVKVK